MIHDGHRERLRKKALEYGFSCLEDHECLELLLGLVILRKNTNDVAHELINMAGSLDGVFEMDIPQLRQVDGVGNVAAFMIKLVGHIMRRPKTPLKKRADLSRASAVKEYAKVLYATAEKEEIFALYLDKKMTLIERAKLSEGNEWQAGISPKDVLAPALINGAAMFILVHNHPCGLSKPSQDDLNFTVRMESASKMLGIYMLEHVIYADGEIYPIMKGSKIRSLNAIEYDEV